MIRTRFSTGFAPAFEIVDAELLEFIHRMAKSKSAPAGEVTAVIVPGYEEENVIAFNVVGSPPMMLIVEAGLRPSFTVIANGRARCRLAFDHGDRWRELCGILHRLDHKGEMADWAGIAGMGGHSTPRAAFAARMADHDRRHRARKAARTKGKPGSASADSE